jgi:hypothetical protein
MLPQHQFFKMPDVFYMLNVVLYKCIFLGEQLIQGKPAIFGTKMRQSIFVCPFISLVRTKLDCWY